MTNSFFLKEWRVATGKTQEQIAAAVDKSVPTIQRWETGARIPGLDDLAEIAAVLHCHPADLLRPPEQAGKPAVIANVDVRGAVQAGYWAESLEWPEGEWYSVPMPPEDARYPGCPLFGLEVRGASMNKVFPPGTVLGCIHLIHHPVNVEPGRYVIAERMNHKGEFEATVKQLEMDENGVYWLWPRSTDPLYQAPFRLDDGEEVRITALVVQSSRPE